MLSRRTTLVAACAVATFSVIAVIIINLVVAQEADEDNPLLADNRTQLSVCVDGAVGYRATTADVETIRQSLHETLSSSPIQPPAEYSDWDVVVGCPIKSAAIEPGQLIEVHVNANIITDPGPHRLFIYLMPPETYRQDPMVLRSGQPYVLGNAETICEGHLCSYASRAIYMPMDAGSEDLSEALLAGLHLLPYTPEPEPTFDRAGCESGMPDIKHCAEYLECRTPEDTLRCDQLMDHLAGIDEAGSLQ